MARNRRQNRGGHRGRDEHRETGHQNQGSRHQQQQQQQQQQGPSPLQQQTGQQLVGLLTQLIGQQQPQNPPPSVSNTSNYGINQSPYQNAPAGGAQYPATPTGYSTGYQTPQPLAPGGQPLSLPAAPEQQQIAPKPRNKGNKGKKDQSKGVHKPVSNRKAKKSERGRRHQWGKSNTGLSFEEWDAAQRGELSADMQDLLARGRASREAEAEVKEDEETRKNEEEEERAAVERSALVHAEAVGRPITQAAALTNARSAFEASRQVINDGVTEQLNDVDDAIIDLPVTSPDPAALKSLRQDWRKLKLALQDLQSRVTRQHATAEGWVREDREMDWEQEGAGQEATRQLEYPSAFKEQPEDLSEYRHRPDEIPGSYQNPFTSRRRRRPAARSHQSDAFDQPASQNQQQTQPQMTVDPAYVAPPFSNAPPVQQNFHGPSIFITDLNAADILGQNFPGPPLGNPYDSGRVDEDEDL